MVRYIALFVTLSLAVAVTAQDAAFQQGLSLHNQQIQEHLRKEMEQQRATGQFGAPQQQQHYQPQPQQYQPQPQQYQQPAPQYNQYQGGEDDGQYRPELYNNPNNFARSNPEQEYQAGIKAHQAQIQAHLQKENRFQPQANQISDPAYQQGLQLHQRQIQDHLQKEQQHGGPAPQAYRQQPQQRAYHEQAAPVQYHNQPSGNNAAQEFESGIKLHMQQLAQHQQQHQQHLAQVGQASEYHQSQQQYQPRNY